MYKAIDAHLIFKWRWRDCACPKWKNRKPNVSLMALIFFSVARCFHLKISTHKGVNWCNVPFHKGHTLRVVLHMSGTMRLLLSAASHVCVKFYLLPPKKPPPTGLYRALGGTICSAACGATRCKSPTRELLKPLNEMYFQYCATAHAVWIVL